MASLKPLLLCALIVAARGACAGDDARAQLQYLQHCSGCHLVDGSGSPGKGIPSMRGTLGRFLQVPGGREFIVQVPGVMHSPLRDGEIANLMNWLVPAVSADSVPAGFQPYSTEEIARLRASRPADIMAVRADLVQKMDSPAAR